MTEQLRVKLFGCNSLSEFLTMFFNLSMEDKLSVFSEEITIEKGTELYRIRQIGDNNDPQDPKEWEPVPVELAEQGRFNSKGESVLYVSSASDFLEREVRLKENSEYYLGRYVCKNTFKVGSFLTVKEPINTLIHKITMSISGEDDLTMNEKKLMDEYFEWAKDKTLFDISVDSLAPLYIYRIFPRLYDATNKLGKLVLMKNDNGFRYSSVYAPIELSGAPVIVTLNGIDYGNYVLTRKGFENIEFVSAEKRIARKPIELDTMISVFSQMEIEERTISRGY